MCLEDIPLGGGPSQTTSTVHNKLPAWEKPLSQQLTKQAMQLYSGSGYPQQHVAPFSPDQLKAMGMTEQLSGPESQFLQGAQGQEAATIGGQYLDPSTNKYLQDYYNAAALPMIQNYQQAVAPNILQNAVASGGLGSSGTEQACQNAQSSLAQGLGTLGANIYEPAYQQERQLQQGATQFAPTMAQGQYIPGQELQGVGTQQQQQAQNILNTIFGNQMMPYNMLTQGAGLIGPLSGGAGSQISVGPNPMATGK